MKTSVRQLALMALFLCINPAAGLQCFTCTDGACSSQTSVNCSSETMCVSEIYSASDSNGKYSGIFKSCSPPSQCNSTGSQFVSVYSGTRSFLRNTSCCDTDNCNAANLSIPAPPAGSLKCYGCDPNSYYCTANVTCNALETCAQTQDVFGTQLFYGCASESMCNNTSLAQYFGYTKPLSCCNSTNCNVPDLGLQCMTCSDSTCSTQHSVTCSKYSPMCYSYAYSVSNLTQNITSINKGCGSPSDCTAAGSQFFSYNSGTYSFFTISKCCNTDNCNAADRSIPPPAGSLQCYGCDPSSSKCTENVTCNALEACGQTSIQTNNGSVTFYGCVSENLCSNTNVSQQFFHNNQSVSCCNTTNCNAPPTTAPPTTVLNTTNVPVSSAAGPVLPLGLLLSLLGLFTLTHTLYF